MAKQHKNKGFTLIEVLVALFVLAIAASFMFVSYTNVMEDQRNEADAATLENIDITLKQLLLYNDAFEDINSIVYDDNKIGIVFKIENDAKLYKDTNGEFGAAGEKDGYIELASAYCLSDSTSEDGKLLKDECPRLYDYLVGNLGNRITLSSNGYQYGEYIVYVEFGLTRVSSVREPVLNNDVIIVTNSGTEYIGSMMDD